MNYVLKRREDGAYVARPGERESYTRSLAKARTFATREAASREACGNESVARYLDEAGARHV